MKRKTSSAPSRVYCYGLRTPHEGAVAVHSQLRLAHRYYNELIAIERERRTEYRTARALVGTTLAGLEAERASLVARIEVVRAELKQRRKTAKIRLVAKDSERSEIALLIEQRKALSEPIRAARAAVKEDPAFMEEEKRINERALAKLKEKRKQAGLYWGTYLLVERAVEAARKSMMDPRFHRFDGTGRVGVQIQNGMSVEELFGNDSRIQIDPLPADSWDTRSGRRHAHAEVRIRVGSDARAPIWAKFRAVIHRKIPDDARVKWAWVKVSRQGPRYRYELQLTLEDASFARPTEERPGLERSAAINLGWRKLEDGRLRVGYLYDVFGNERELTLPAKIHAEISKASSVRSFNDVHFNTAKLVLGGWAKEHPELVPEALREDLKTMHAWVSRGRLGRAASFFIREMQSYVWKAWVRWRAERLAAGLDLFAEFSEITAWLGSPTPLEAITTYLDFWQKKEKHLWDMEASKVARARRRRSDIYRNLAHELSQTYGLLVVEDTSFSDELRNVAPEADPKLASPTKRMARSASPSALRMALEQAFGKDRVHRLTPKHTTVVHYGCGHKNDGLFFAAERAAQIEVTCEACGQAFDQDANASKNLLSLFLMGEPLAAETKKRASSAR